MGNKKIWMTIIMVEMLLIYTLYYLANTMADPDLWGYLAFGRLFWESGQFPYQDVYSYVPTLNPWVYHEWLTGVILYPIYEKTGALGLQLLRYIFGLLTVVLIYLTARQRGADPPGAIAILLIIVGYLRFGYSPVRAQIFTYFFFVLTLYLLERSRKTRQWYVLGVIPLFMIFWCNLHGGFVSGLGLIAMYALGEAVARRTFWPYVGLFALSAIATLINPYGLKYWSYLLYAVTMPRPEINEWVSFFQYVWNDSHLVFLIYHSAIIVFAILLMVWGKWRDITASLALGVTLYQGLLHVRHIVFFLILIGAYMPVIVTPFLQKILSWPRVMILRRVFGWKIAISLACFFLIYGGYNFLNLTPWRLKVPSQPLENRGGIYYPVAAIEFMRAHNLPGKLLVSFDWGEYALWNLYPQCKVALDGRYETVYPESLSKEYFDFLYARANWQRFLDHYPPDMILVGASSKIHSLLQKEPHWEQVFLDSGSVLFLRRDYQPRIESQSNPAK
jgi:hypothetical protein